MRAPRIRPRVHTFKKIIYHAEASVAAATKNDFEIAKGVDDVNPKQATNIDTDVPTGSTITDIYVWLTQTNLVSVANTSAVTMQMVQAGQAGTVNPFSMGGNSQRNQIYKTKFHMLGKDQNVNTAWHFKVPRKYQRMREGQIWRLTTNCTQIRTEACMAIYKIQS